MTAHQIATNSKAIRNLAGRLESLGFTGEAYEVAERLAMNLLADGYRPVEPPAPMVGTGSTLEARQAAKEALRVALDEAKRKRTAGPRTPPA